MIINTTGVAPPAGAPPRRSFARRIARVWPLGAILTALAATLVWIAALGYGLFRLIAWLVG